jgi:hypothetical protein
MPRSRSEILRSYDWIAAGAITALVLYIHFTRVLYAGPPWRDEIAALNLARMNWGDILRYFPHEAFPLFFPTLVRGYTSLTGTGETALRLFGFSIGVFCLGAIWLNSVLIRSRPPLLALVLFGFNPVFFIWGDSIRGYGLGAALIMLTFGLFARTIIKPGPAVFCAALLSAVLSVQSLLGNAVILFAICVSAAVAGIFQGRIRHAVIVLGIGGVAALSILPYFGPYHSGREWDIIFRTGLSLRQVWSQLRGTLASPIGAMLWLWLILALGSVIGVAWLMRQRSPEKSQDKSLAVFAVLACVLSLICYFVFLKTLGYPARDWYYLTLIAVLIVSVDAITGILADQLEWIRPFRVTLAVILSVILAGPAFTKARERMTNMDLVAQALRQKAGPDDFIMIIPWHLGIAFSWHYQSQTPWETLPPISDLRVHRYDLVKEQMALSDPLGQLRTRVADTLKSGHRLWLVGEPTIPEPGQVPPSLAPAPYDPIGWNESAYTKIWSIQMAYFIQSHALHADMILPRATQPTNKLENVQVIQVEGWRGAF